MSARDWLACFAIELLLMAALFAAWMIGTA